MLNVGGEENASILSNGCVYMFVYASTKERATSPFIGKEKAERFP